MKAGTEEFIELPITKNRVSVMRPTIYPVQNKEQSFNNISYNLSGGKSRIPVKSATTVLQSKVKSFANIRNNTSGGKSRMPVESAPTVVQSKVKSFINISHKPSGGKVKIVNRKLDYSNVKAKVNTGRIRP
ncbi:microtubule-associated protein tau-like [Cryptotermes secundus]|uniref:microtubule-associated protein tau-like n=1 Tax=Cryptotermes secundus TaxID=105785 RepID=UPI001454DD8C|nr:microtubule-associated protein tau-like [Cryptotermes secundus]XP_033609967.1 microtubule-associated protein tau-like [Cryptotermes secundus]